MCGCVFYSNINIQKGYDGVMGSRMMMPRSFERVVMCGRIKKVQMNSVVGISAVPALLTLMCLSRRCLSGAVMGFGSPRMEFMVCLTAGVHLNTR